MSGSYERSLKAPVFEEGDTQLWASNGLAILGNAAFEQFSPIENHQFSGCVANRNEGGVLVIMTPVDTLRFRYSCSSKLWFQIVPNLSQPATGQFAGEYRNVMREGGPLWGTLTFAVMWSIRLLFYVWILLLVGAYLVQLFT